ncbi:hypothetical protein BS47DRAFT_584425 [Hydnum rufescens UP504]|uniref:CRAL-TRIO domain-containing protein n=1 Tax=Hydnum rufescens UP504 TaxID=1448309 RepID=A0A9P6DZP2_9AGAM|nr:hypothetical protein BS47DRAFT_584425 [Hydnum rufescens UP504]
MLPSRQNTDDPVRQLQYTVWTLERCIDLMGPGVEGLDFLIDFSDRGKNPSLGTARKMLNILQDHYPERLGRALVINIPFIVNAFFNLIMPFVDPVTRVKVRFNPQVVTEGLFTSDMITKNWGGDVEFIYKHDEYWPALLGITNGLREQHMARWEKLGGRIGLSEWDVKGVFEDAVANGNEEATDISTPAEVGGEPEAEV